MLLKNAIFTTSDRFFLTNTVKEIGVCHKKKLKNIFRESQNSFSDSYTCILILQRPELYRCGLISRRFRLKIVLLHVYRLHNP